MLTLHWAVPAIMASPEPMIETSADSIALASTLPEPAIDTLARFTSRPPARTSPDPAIEKSAVSAAPDALTPPDPAIEKRVLFALSEATSISPDPAIEAANSSAWTLSIVMSPEPATSAPLSEGAVTWTVIGPWSLLQPNDHLPFF